MQTPSEIVQTLLKEPTNIAVVSRLVAPDATYVSLDYDNAELKKIMTWTGTAKGPQAIVDTYTRVGQYWENQKADRSGECGQIVFLQPARS